MIIDWNTFKKKLWYSLKLEEPEFRQYASNYIYFSVVETQFEMSWLVKHQPIGGNKDLKMR